MQTIFRDLKYAVRTLVKRPAFTATAVVTLALGIGATSAVFSVANAILLRPLPYQDSSRLVMIEGNFVKMGMSNIGASAREFMDYRDEASSLERVAAFSNLSLNLTGIDVPEKVQAARVSEGLFELLGVDPLVGRAFRPGDDGPGSNNVAVL